MPDSYNADLVFTTGALIDAGVKLALKEQQIWINNDRATPIAGTLEKPTVDSSMRPVLEGVSDEVWADINKHVGVPQWLEAAMKHGYELRKKPTIEEELTAQANEDIRQQD